jgi:hypothetical protein
MKGDVKKWRKFHVTGSYIFARIRPGLPFFYWARSESIGFCQCSQVFCTNQSDAVNVDCILYMSMFYTRKKDAHNLKCIRYTQYPIYYISDILHIRFYGDYVSIFSTNTEMQCKVCLVW